jgi:hypothetical protein
MIISDQQIIQLMTQLKEHIEFLTRIGKMDNYRSYLIDFYAELTDQQSTELRVVE